MFSIVSSSQEVQSLQQAQSVNKNHKKHEEEVNGHSVELGRRSRRWCRLESGQKFLDGPSFPSSNEVIENTAALKDVWTDLLNTIAMKGAKLKVQFKSLKRSKFSSKSARWRVGLDIKRSSQLYQI